MKINDLFDPDLLEEMLAERFVHARADEQLPILVYDYQPRAQYEREWNDVTRICRGLLVHAETGEILARPLPKFFTWNEPDAPTIGHDVPVEVYDKADGSMGTLYAIPGRPGEYAVSTRGSLRSVQARRATRIWQDRYADVFTPNPEWTYVFEIIDPTSRIVLDYAGVSDLYLIGANVTDTGEVVPFDEVRSSWPGPAVAKFDYTTLGEALAAAPRPGAEGYVVLDPTTGTRVKIKQEDYKLLHSIVTAPKVLDLWTVLAIQATPFLEPRPAAQKFKMRTEKVIELRESMANGLNEMLASIPDELFGTVAGILADLRGRAATLTQDLTTGFEALPLADLPGRKEQAALIRQAAPDKFHEHAWLKLLNGGNIADMVWAHLRPGPDELIPYLPPELPLDELGPRA